MSTPPMCEVDPVGGDGLIDPEQFVIRSDMVGTAASQIAAAGDRLTEMGDDLLAAMDGISAEWWKLPSYYEAPEASEVYLLLNPACDDAGVMRATLTSAATFLTDYADAVGKEKETIRELTARASAFRRDVVDGVWIDASESANPTLGDLLDAGTAPERQVHVHWSQDLASATTNTRLLEEHAAIAHRINVAAVECARGINALVGTLPDGFVEPEVIPEWALASGDIPMAWGYPVEEDRNWVEQIGHVPWRFGNEFGTTVAAAFTGYDTLTDEHSWATAGQTWAGIGNFLGSAAVSILGAPLVFVAAVEDPADRDGFMQWLVERNRVFTGAVAGMASVDTNAYVGHATDDWEDEPVGSAVYTVANVASLAAGVGVFSVGRAAAIAARSGALSARFARLAAMAGEFVDFALPGSGSLVAGSIRFWIGVFNGSRHVDFEINPAAFADAFVHVADDAVDHTPVSEELFGAGDGDGFDAVDPVDVSTEAGPWSDPPGGTDDATGGGGGPPGEEPPSTGGDRGNGGGGDDDAPRRFDPEARVPRTMDPDAAPRPWTDADAERAFRDAPVDADGVSVDHRTGASLDLTGDRGGWTMRWSPADGQWHVENAYPPASLDATGNSPDVATLTGRLREAGPDTFDVGRGDLYDSGDPRHPGVWPRETPAETYSAQQSEGVLHSKLRNGESWRNYQHQISGWDPTSDGLVPEYRRNDPTSGDPIDFDGRALRPDGRYAMLEAKFGHRELVFDPDGAFASRVRRQLPGQIADRLEVLGPNEILEYHVSDPYGAAGLREIVDEAGFGERVTVIYTPAI